jgi:hypothetical protein
MIRINIHIKGMLFYSFSIHEHLNDCADRPPARKGRAVWVSVPCTNPSKPVGFGDISWPK